MIRDRLRTTHRMQSPPISPADKTPGDGVTAEGESYPSRRLQFVDVAPPQPGICVEIAEGVLWSRIPLPIDLNHINVWLLDCGDGCVVVDTGMAAEIGKSAWQRIASQVFVDKPLRAVFVTHIHPDHIGLAGWLQQQYSAPVWMSARTLDMAKQLLSGANLSNADEAEAFLRANGVEDVSALKPMFSPTRFARMASGLPEVERLVADCDVLELGSSSWTALETNGHAEGHLCLSNTAQRLLISGDQVLPTISSNISYRWRSADPNPLHSFLSSLQRLRTLAQDTLVLPSHGIPFRGLAQRVDDLTQHHEEQLEKIVTACQEPRAAFDLLRFMFRRELSGMHLFLGLGEALAHLEYLFNAGRLDRRQHADGVTRYERLSG